MLILHWTRLALVILIGFAKLRIRILKGYKYEIKRWGFTLSLSLSHVLSLSKGSLRKPVVFIVTVLLIFGTFFSTLTFVPSLQKARAAGNTYYVSPSGSNTAPYDTWAKAANLPSTAMSAGDSTTGPHTVYIAPGTYTDHITMSTTQWNNSSIIGTTAYGSTAPATMAQLTAGTGPRINNNEIAVYLFFNGTLDNVTVSNLEINGQLSTKTAVYVRYNTQTAAFNNIYAHGTFSNIITNNGTATINRSSLSKDDSSNGLAVANTGTMNLNYVNISPGPNSPLTQTSVSGILNSGTFNMIHSSIYGAMSQTITSTAGTFNLRNSYVGAPWAYQEGIYTVNFTGGTFNAYNNVIMQTYRMHTLFNSPLTVDSNNIKTSQPFWTSMPKEGIVTLDTDDTGGANYVRTEVLPVWKSKGVKGTFYIYGSGYASYKSDVDGIYADPDKTVELGSHTWSHPDVTYLYALHFSNSGSGCTIAYDSTTHVFTGDGCAIPASNFTYDATNKMFYQIITDISGNGKGWTIANSTTGGQIATHVATETKSTSLATKTATSVPADILYDKSGVGSGFYKDEYADMRTWMQTTFPGWDKNVLAMPFGANDDASSQAAYNAGYVSNRISWNYTPLTIDKLSAINLYKLPFGGVADLITNGLSTDDSASADALIQTRVRALAQYLGEKGGMLSLLAHFHAECTGHQWGIIIDTLKEFPNIRIMTESAAVNYIKTSGHWTTSDNMTYNRTWTDQSNFQLQSISPAIDAGTNISLTTDYSGNKIYGLPDIGAYEYQPPHTMGTDKIDIGAGGRIYGDGKFRDVATTNSTLADLKITPSGGTFSETTSPIPAWLDISGITWSNSGNHHKVWTESNAEVALNNTDHVVGDLEPNKYYNVKVDNVLGASITGGSCTSGICLANGSGVITFTYSGGYSTHVFDVDLNTTPPTMSMTINPASPDGSNSWYVTQPSIALLATDLVSGINAILFHWDSSGDQLYTSAISAPEGNHTLYYSALDNAGNLSTGSQEVKTDLNPPEFNNLPGDNRPVNLTDGEVITTNPYIIKVLPTDISGIEKVEFLVDDNLLCTETEPDADGVYSCSWDTTKYHSDVKIIAYDFAGETSTLLRTVIVASTLPQTGKQ